jgi:uncharacterized small protein (DUF1192 family)
MANESKRHQKIDGLSIYLGVIPAQLTQKHYKMHGGITKNEHSYHIVVAIFDEKTQKRITGAKVKATISALGMSGKSKELETMHGELLSYGNYFSMNDAILYRIKVEIDRKNKTKAVANFIFNRPIR